MSRLMHRAQDAALVVALFALAGPAHAGLPTPAPLVGAGAPALLALAGAYYLIRRARKRD